MLWVTATWFWGLQFAVLNPMLSVLLVGLYHATPSEVGLALGAYNLGAFVTSLVVPVLADRRRDYLRPLVVCGACAIALVVALLLTSSFPVALVTLVLLGGPPSVGSTLLFAELRRSGAPPARVVRTRAVVSFAWVVGPPLVTVVIGVFAERAALVLLMAISAVNVVTSVVLLRRAHAPLARDPAAPPVPPAPTRLLSARSAAIVLAFLVLQVTNAATTTTAALFVTEQLGASIVWAGVALSAAALLEIPALLLIGRLLERVRGIVLVAGGSAAGALYYLGVSTIRTPLALVLLQPLNAVFFAVVAGVGLTLFPQSFGSPGFASGLFTNVRRAASVLSGGLIALALAATHDYGSLYGLSGLGALVVLVAAVLVLATRRPGERRRRAARAVTAPASDQDAPPRCAPGGAARWHDADPSLRIRGAATMRRTHDTGGTAGEGPGHGFDLAAAAAQGPLTGSDQTNGVVDVTQDRVDESESEYSTLFRRLAQGNIGGIGTIV